MSLVPAAVVRPPATGRRPQRGRAALPWLVLCCYLLAAVAITWQLWADPAGRMQAGDPHDVDLFAWFLRYDAVAVAHWHLPPLVTTAMNAPRGINLMWNTSLLLPGTLLAPVTLLASPQVSLTVLLTLGFAGSAASLFWVLRRWGASITAAALGGGVYGFCPALVNSGVGHYHLQFAVLPPLMIDALLRIVIARGNPVRCGVWLGLLAAAQVFTGEELLADTAIASLLLVTVLAASRPRAVPDRLWGVAYGIGMAALVVLALCGHALWVQFHGPLAQHNHPVGPDPFYNRAAFFVEPPGSLLLHTPGSAAAAAGYSRGLAEYLGYLGWPLLAVLAAATARFWGDLRVRAAATLWLALDVLSLGGGTTHSGWFEFPGWLLPFHWLQGAPVLSQVLPDRLSILADGAAAAVLAFSLDLARQEVQQAAGRRTRTLPGVIPAAVAVLAVLPLIPLPFQVMPVTPVPAGWQAAFTRLHLAADARVLIVPIPLQRSTQPLRWQADTGEPASMIGGYFVGPNRSGQQMVYIPGPTTTAAQYLDSLGGEPEPARPLQHGLIRADLRYWKPAAVVAITSRNSPLGRFLIRLFGQPSFGVGSVLAWRGPLVPRHGLNRWLRHRHVREVSAVRPSRSGAPARRPPGD